MAAIHDLLNQIPDPKLRERIAREWEAATRHKKFGLVFEQHLPEVVPIYSAKPRKGDLVAKRSGSLNETWRVRRIEGGTAHLMKPQQAGEKESAGERMTMPTAELVVVKQFGDPIFPTLVPMDAVQNGPADAPWHTLIEADNYHALQLLEYLYAGKVDCIYIDPPYNSGARDWKYNNDYVDGNDAWRHSKWLSFMEKRLQLAGRLVNKSDGVLIITIDEKEYANLSVLLDEVFPDARIQMISSLINPAGVARAGGFSRSDEYIFFVMFGQSSPQKSKLKRDWVSGKGRTHTGTVRWDLLRRSGTNAERSHSPGCFYPVYVNPETREIVAVGKPLPQGASEAPYLKGAVAVLPIRKNKDEGNWQWSPETFEERRKQGRVRIGGNAKRGFVVYILKDGEFAKIERGEFVVSDKDINGALIVERGDAKYVTAIPHSQWRIPEHDATQYGTRLLAKVLPNVAFPFPKSVYAVRDALRFFVGNKPNALVIDFFAGSGTTAHAVQLLNCLDDGQRRCIVVTNNEVSAIEADTLTAAGINPDHPTWSEKGIARSITWPRIKCVTTGLRQDGTPIDGEVDTGKICEISKARKIFHAAFTSPKIFQCPPGVQGKEKKSVERAIEKRKRAFLNLLDSLPQSIATADCQFIVSDEHSTAVLFDPAAVTEWLEALEGRDHVTDVHIVAEDEKQFKSLKAQVDELLGPLIVHEEEKRLMSAGFPANFAYFKLDFLDKDRVELGAAFREILPLLWMKSGAIGPSPTLPDGPLPDLFIPEASPFAVLLNETRVTAFREALLAREALRHVYVVTDAEEAFRAISVELRSALIARNPDVEFVQLYRDYLVNFTINTRAEDAAAGIGGVA